jgi:hypothetical protein
MRCAACGLEPFPADAPRDHETGLPPGWYRHVIARRTFVLCECCGDIRHFKGGISLYLQETLGLPPHAGLDSAASGEVGSGLHRLRRQR